MKKIQEINYSGNFNDNFLKNEILKFQKRLEILNNEKYNYNEIISEIPVGLTLNNTEKIGVRTIYQIEKEQNFIGTFDVFKNLDYTFFTIYLI
jgi:hypothetical protein